MFSVRGCLDLVEVLVVFQSAFGRGRVSGACVVCSFCVDRLSRTLNPQLFVRF